MSGWMLAFGQSLVWIALAAVLGVVVGVLVARSRPPAGSHGPENSRRARSGTVSSAAAGAGDSPVGDSRRRHGSALPEASAGEPSATARVSPAVPAADVQGLGGTGTTPPRTDTTGPRGSGTRARTGTANADTVVSPTRGRSVASEGDRTRRATTAEVPFRPVLDDAEVQLKAAQARIDALTEELAEMEGRGAIEYGRLEAAAIRSLDEIIVADQQRIDSLQAQLERAEADLRDSEQHRAINDRKFESLRLALGDRDNRIFALDNELKQLRRAQADLQIKEGPR